MEDEFPGFPGMEGGRVKRRGGAKGGKLAEAVEEGEKARTDKSVDEVKAALTTVAVTAPDKDKPAAIAKVIAANPSAIRQIIDRAVGVAKPVAAVVAVATALNKPTLYGNIARVAAATINTAIDTAITSTWAQWGVAAGDVVAAVGSIGRTLFNQALQGPVVPFAAAMAIQSYRASSRNIGILQLTKEDVLYLPRLPGDQLAKAKAAYAEEAARLGARQTDVPRVLAEVAASLESASTGRQSAIGFVPGEGEGTGVRIRNPPAALALAPIVNAPPGALQAAADERGAAAVLMGISQGPPAPGANAAAPAGPAAAAPALPPGGRRRRKTKRKAPKRRRAVTRKALTFVY